MLDFTKNNTNYQTTDSNVYLFRIGAKVLNSPRLMHMKLKDLIKNESVVTFSRKKDMVYG